MKKLRSKEIRGAAKILRKFAVRIFFFFLRYMCDTPFPGGPLTTRQPAEYSWMSGNPTPLTKIGQSSFVREALPKYKTCPNSNHKTNT